MDNKILLDRAKQVVEDYPIEVVKSEYFNLKSIQKTIIKTNVSFQKRMGHCVINYSALDVTDMVFDYLDTLNPQKLTPKDKEILIELNDILDDILFWWTKQLH